jgi:bifunctional non-homologous end joining protein LigD
VPLVVSDDPIVIDEIEEIAAHGLSQFKALRRREAADTAVLFAFELLERDGQSFQGHPLEARKQMLARLLRGCGHVLLCDHIAEDGPLVFAHACRPGAEGIISKRLGRPYPSGRNESWIKVKNPVAVEAHRQRSENWNR